MRAVLVSTPEWLWVAVCLAFGALALGAAGVLGGVALLFPSVGPTLALQIHAPTLSSARPRAVAIGHGSGLAAGAGAALMVGVAAPAEADLTGALAWTQVVASALALAAAAAIQSALGAIHPPSAAATLLFSLGTVEPRPESVGVLALGVAATLVVGEPLRRAALIRR